MKRFIQGFLKTTKSAKLTRDLHKSSDACFMHKSPCSLSNKRASTFMDKIKDSILVVEAKQGPVGKLLVGIAQGLATGGFVFGSGALVYYSLLHQSSPHSFEHGKGSDKYLTLGALNVPEYVKERVETVYMYVANSLAVSALGAAVSFRLFSTPAFLNVISMNPLMAIGLTMGCQFAVTMLVRSLPYEEGIGMKQIGSVVQAGLIGLAAAPMYLLGAQSIIRAGYVTAGVMAGLTGISTIVPHDAFIKWEGPLRVAMYSVFVAFMALWFMPRGHPLHNFVYKIAMHGGLVVFPAYYLFNSKAAIQNAMFAPTFDPINTSMAMYTDVLNIYVRLAFLLPPRYLIWGDNRSLPWAAKETKSKSD